jgi:flavin-dependent dehydrogenase
VRRDVLAAALLDAAGRAGAGVRVGVAVSDLVVRNGLAAAVRTADGDLEARAVVAADGLHSPLRRRLGLDASAGSRRRYGLSCHVRTTRDLTSRVDVFFEPGYELYVTPVGPRAANVAILASRPQMARFAGGAERAVRALLDAHPFFGPGYTLEDGILVTGPFARTCRRAWRGNVVLAGDAAGFYDGISGEGMSAALISGRLAAAAVDRYLERADPTPLRAYDARRRAIVRNPELLARLSLFLTARPALAAFAVRNLARRPATFRRLVAVNSGGAPLTSLRFRDAPALLLGL